MKDILQKIDALEGTAPPTLRGKDTLKPMSKPGKYGEPHPTKGKFVGGEGADPVTGKMEHTKCMKCKKGTYKETSIHDDWDGVVHCDKCGHEVKNTPDKVNEAGLEEEKIYSKMKKDFLDFLKTPEKKSDKFKSDDAIDAVDNDELKEGLDTDFHYKGYTYWGQQDSDGFWWIMYEPALPPEIDANYNKVARDGQIEAKGREAIDAVVGVNEDVSPQELNYVKDIANSLWNKLGVDIHFTKHFFERVNDPRNKKPITAEELVRLFKKEYNAYGDKIRELDDNDQAVLLDLFTKLNVPVVVRHDDKGSTDMIAKTVMRNPNFKTSDPKFQVETVGWFGSERKKLNEQARKESNEVAKLSKLVEEITKRHK